MTQGSSSSPNDQVKNRGDGKITNKGEILNRGGTVAVNFHGVMNNLGTIEEYDNGVTPFRSSIRISYGHIGGPDDTFVNAGDIVAGQGTSLNFLAAHSGATYGGMLYNSGQIECGQAIMVLDTPVTQIGSGKIEEGRGSLILKSGVNGGTVAIDSGNLQFSGPVANHAGPISAWEFHAALQLVTPISGQVSPDIVPSIAFLSFENTPITEVFKNNALLVYTEWSRREEPGFRHSTCRRPLQCVGAPGS